MDRHVLASVLAAFVLTAGCATAGAPPQAGPVPTPVPTVAPAVAVECPVPAPNQKPVWSTSAPEFQLSVDENAIPEFSCLSIKKGVTSVTWVGGENVRQLLVLFKDECQTYAGQKPKKKPADPSCAGDACTLEKAKHRMTGEFCYSVVVVRNDGTVKAIDPRLIINP